MCPPQELWVEPFSRRHAIHVTRAAACGVDQSDEGLHNGTADASLDFCVWGDGGDGWVVEYAVRQNGQYSMTVFSEFFWTNDYSALLGAISQRDPADYPKSSHSGEFEPFPRWSDPAVS